MNSHEFRIRAGEVSEVKKEPGEWLFVDVGFSSKGLTCGVVEGERTPEAKTFGGLVDLVVQKAKKIGEPLNLLLEAPLSAAFNEACNPTGRSFEKSEDGQHPYWYENAGGVLIVATGHLLRAVVDCERQREVRLFEGFVSFTPKGDKSTDTYDALSLRKAVWNTTSASLFGPGDLKMKESDTLKSALAFAGMDFGIPPVVVVQPGSI